MHPVRSEEAPPTQPPCDRRARRWGAPDDTGGEIETCTLAYQLRPYTDWGKYAKTEPSAASGLTSVATTIVAALFATGILEEKPKPTHEPLLGYFVLRTCMTHEANGRLAWRNSMLAEIWHIVCGSLARESTAGYQRNSCPGAVERHTEPPGLPAPPTPRETPGSGCSQKRKHWSNHLGDGARAVVSWPS